MMTTRSGRRLSAHTPILLAALVGMPAAQSSEEQDPVPTRRLLVDPPALELDAGETAQLSARVLDAAGAELEEELIFYSRARKSLSVDAQGKVEALDAGEFTIVVRTRRAPRPSPDAAVGASDEAEDTGEPVEPEAEPVERLSVKVPVRVRRLPLESLTLEAPSALFAGTIVELEAVARDTRGIDLEGVDVRLESSDPTVASFDVFGRLHVHRPGPFSAVAEAEGQRTEHVLEARLNPVHAIEITSAQDHARTGDVVHFTVVTRDAAGAALQDVPVTVSLTSRLDDELGPAASGQVARGHRGAGDWRFVAETPGLYSLEARCGAHGASAGVRIDAREYDASLELVGRGAVSETHTSDLWVWEGLDGRDYAVTGTWGADGEALFWDVTDPAAIERVGSVKVDARTVNDVKVSSDGRLCVISREGASDRKNGIVMIDVSDPREPEILGSYDEGLTGGVHNLFIDGRLVYALSNGRRYDIIDVSDPKAAQTIGSYELDTPGHSIHDVWVEDGLAYSSNWSDGVHIVDVGNGVRGGSPENPVYVGSYAYPSGWNHAAFPYHDKETGRFYVVAGDEAFPYGLHIEDEPTYARGWLHFIDFTDFDQPVEVARYQVPEAGTHNLWIEDDVAYVAYYNGGVLVVDLSGELMGDLYRQGREMAFFLPADPEGHIANAPMVWGPQPHKGNLFFSDWNSGLWCVRLDQGPKE
jgi:hypothetical protein